jgi:flagellar protein FlgJ
MEIGNLNALYAADERFAALSPGRGKSAMPGGLRAPGASGGGLPPFAELLERSYGGIRGGEETPAGEIPPPEKPEFQGAPPNPDKIAALPPGSSSAPAFPLKKAVVDKAGQLYEQCEALETFLIKNLVKSMRSTIQKSELIDTGFAGEVYEDMLYDEYAGSFSKNAHFGFAEMAYLELTGQRGKKVDFRISL